MKNLRTCASGLRAFLAAILLFTSSIAPAVAEWITIQIPLTMATRSFTFWEEGAWDAEPLLLEVPADQMGYVLGDYSQSSSGVPIMMGGSIGTDGLWHPDGSSYATISAFRQSTGMFFLRDESTLQISPPNQTGLLYAEWRTLNASAPLRFVAINENRHDHLLAFVSDTDFVPLTNGLVQRGIGNDGQEYSLGFFNAWATGIDPLKFGNPDGRIVDLTGQEAAWGAANLIDSADWSIDSTPYSVQPLNLLFASIELGREFDVFAGGSATRVEAVYNQNTLQTEGSPAISIGAGVNFYVMRVGEFGFANGVTQWHQMPPNPFTFNASAELPPAPGDPVMTNLHFRVDVALNPWSLSVHSNATGSNTTLTVNGWQSTGSFYGPAGWVQRDYYDCWAEVDTSAGWAVFNGVPTDLGMGPDLIEWPPAPPQSTIVLPAQRRGNGIVSSQGLAAVLTSNGAPSDLYDSFTGQPYSVTWDTYDLTVNDLETSTITLADDSTGETSWSWSFTTNSSIQSAWQMWLPSSPLLLRISGTRWRNQLEVRCADGTVYPLSIHRMQGDWSVIPGTTESWFNPYGFFDATTTCKAGIPWHLYDVTRSEYLAADTGDPASFITATDSTDTDMDGLPDWYEVLIGTNPTNPNTDGDSQGNDGYEVAHGTNPLAQPVTASGATLKVFTPLEP